MFELWPTKKFNKMCWPLTPEKVADNDKGHRQRGSVCKKGKNKIVNDVQRKRLGGGSGVKPLGVSPLPGSLCRGTRVSLAPPLSYRIITSTFARTFAEPEQ